MTYKDIVKTEAEIREEGYGIANNIIEKITMNVIGHFGNCVSLEIACSNVCAYTGYNNTANAGFILKALVEMFDLTEEDGIRIEKLRNIPVRLAFDNASASWGDQVIGFGHYMKDKFVLSAELARIEE